MKIAYITVSTPYKSSSGNGEPFILPEILELICQGAEVVVIPLRPGKELEPGYEAKKVSEYTLYIPLLNIQVFLSCLYTLFLVPGKMLKVLFNIIRHSGSIKKVFKNLLIIPKALAVTKILIQQKVDFIHAHWASTPSTLAYIVSYISNIPWGFTAHRWDITENNMLKEKVRTAAFYRAISKRGYKKIMDYVRPQDRAKGHILHVGVRIQNQKLVIEKRQQNSPYIVALPARFVPVKGHEYLIKAVKVLIDRSRNIVCYLFGDGPLEYYLKQMAEELGLVNHVIFKGKVPHDELLKLYENRTVDCVVLPSISMDEEVEEGIPVALMEPMACRIPVISTNTGGIPELLGYGGGIMVEQKRIDQLAQAIERLMGHSHLQKTVGDIGYGTVFEHFHISGIVKKLIDIIYGSIYKEGLI